MKCYIALGKYGDIVTALPIIKRHFDQTGKKPEVITSEKYSSLFHGCGYIKRVIVYPGHWSDLRGAIKFAKGMFNDVAVLQCHGDGFPFQHTKPSYQHEVFDRVGLLNEWKKFKPEFDRRDPKRERALLEGHGLVDAKYILLADHSESSPFKQIEELKMLLASKFGAEHKIVLLSKIRAQQIYDLLAVYENAAALVSTESVHTHLAWATNVPMFVLAADGWRGSAFRKGFAFYLKYAEWERRKNDFISAIENFLKKSPLMKTSVFETVKPHGYNLSSISFGGRTFYTYRYHSGNWKTNLMISMDGRHFPLQVDPAIENHSHEDCRLFVFDGRLHGVYTVAAELQGAWKCYQAYGAITNEGDEWRIGHIQIRYPGNDFSGTNKNWCPLVHDGTLYFIYGIQGANQVVLQVDSNRIRLAHHSPAPRWGHGEIRGGIILPRGDTLLRFFHSRADYADKSIRYFVGVGTMEGKPPFKTLKVCKSPVLQGDDEFVPGCKHWKGNVKFCLGAIQQGDKILLSYGKNDSSCEIIELSERDLNL